MSLHYNADNSYLFVNGQEIFKFKAENKNFNCPTQFCLGIISNGFLMTKNNKKNNVKPIYSIIKF